MNNEYPTVPKTITISEVEYETRINPETFQPEVFYDGEWVPIEPLKIEENK